MRVALVGAELEENLGLRYMASALESRSHEVTIIPFNSESDLQSVVQQVGQTEPSITGLSMVFTGRARQFCRLAAALRESGYAGHIIAGGHFASFNADRLLREFPAFDSVGLGEGEEVICNLAENLDGIEGVPGICYRAAGTSRTNPSTGNPQNLDILPFPKRTVFHSYFGKPIASILSSRGCWRSCAFCSINAWYRRGGGRRFRIRSVENIVAEMKELYVRYGIRIFNFQDDNFFLPDTEEALKRFEELRNGLRKAGVEQIAIAIKARPDSITLESIRVLDDLGLFRVFLGVENASENGLRNLNRRCEYAQIEAALRILNQFDVHVAFNILMFEPDTVMDDIAKNLLFLEKHVENPLNFCRAEAYAGTGLEAKLVSEGRLLGDYFGFDYRLKDRRCEAFHQVANYAFFDRNFSDFGLHYFNMQVDFSFQLIRRFHPQLLTFSLRAAVRNFIKETNLDTYQRLCEVYDFITSVDPGDHFAIRGFARQMRERVDTASLELQARGQFVLDELNNQYETRSSAKQPSFLRVAGVAGPVSEERQDSLQATIGAGGPRWFGVLPTPIPYAEFQRFITRQDG